MKAEMFPEGAADIDISVECLSFSCVAKVFWTMICGWITSGVFFFLRVDVPSTAPVVYSKLPRSSLIFLSLRILSMMDPPDFILDV